MTQKARAVILAAGESKRMQGAQKLLMPFRGKPMIEYALEAAAAWDPVVVASPEVAEYLGERHGIAVIVNDKPQLGMSHSLKLANEHVPPHPALLILLADKPLVSRALIETVAAASAGVDIAYPQRGNEPGHPVFFSANARARVAALPDGDSISLLRDSQDLLPRPLPIDDPNAYFDIDERRAFGEVSG